MRPARHVTKPGAGSSGSSVSESPSNPVAIDASDRELISAYLKAHERLRALPFWPPPADARLGDATPQADPKTASKSGKKKKKERETEQRAVEVVAKLRAAADLAADLAAAEIRAIASKFKRLRCPPQHVANYMEVENRVLGSLYLEASRPAPQTLTLKSLGFVSPSTPESHSSVHRSIIASFASLAVLSFLNSTGLYCKCGLGLPPIGIEIRESLIFSVLDCIFASERNIPELRAKIEEVFGRIPNDSDGLKSNEQKGAVFCEVQ